MQALAQFLHALGCVQTNQRLVRKENLCLSGLPVDFFFFSHNNLLLLIKQNIVAQKNYAPKYKVVFVVTWNLQKSDSQREIFLLLNKIDNG